MRMTNATFHVLGLASVLVLGLACDPKAPVQSSEGDAEVDDKIALHASDPVTHTNLQVPIANVTGDVTGAKIQDGSISGADLADAAIGPSQLADASVGATKIAGGAVGPQALAANAVQTAAIADLMVTTGKLADAAVDPTKLANDAVTSGKIMDGQVANGDLGADAVTSAKIMDGQVMNGDLGANAVTSGKIMDGQVMNGDLGADAVTTAKIMDGEVTTNDLDAAAVTTAKIADFNVTATKLHFSTSGRETADAAFQDIQLFKSGAGGTAPPAQITVTLACGAEGGTAGDIRIIEGANVQDSVVCPANSAANPLMVQMTFSAANNKNYQLQAKAGAANSAVVWRFLNIVGSANTL